VCDRPLVEVEIRTLRVDALAPPELAL